MNSHLSLEYKIWEWEILIFDELETYCREEMKSFHWRYVHKEILHKIDLNVCCMPINYNFLDAKAMFHEISITATKKDHLLFHEFTIVCKTCNIYSFPPTSRRLERLGRIGKVQMISRIINIINTTRHEQSSCTSISRIWIATLLRRMRSVLLESSSNPPCSILDIF